ncbi:uncharacterized protein LOC132169039 [Corylus avellana]|uniref:uncharacterized protein LOC132169039 n=1 Tax=Corylus avellana TaxID=13451 RepID=UPI00286B9DE4|nr:uncharacterized protein LOC132169039 [Corylus avellana]
MESPPRAEQSIKTWEKPPLGIVKLNWDAAIDVGRQKMGVGIIARDHAGNVLAVFCASRPLVIDPTVAEDIVAWKATDVCMLMGFSKVILEGDSIEVVKALKGDDWCWNRYGSLINDAKSTLNSLQDWHVCHTKRLANSTAHLLAKHRLTVSEDQL